MLPYLRWGKWILHLWCVPLFFFLLFAFDHYTIGLRCSRRKGFNSYLLLLRQLLSNIDFCIWLLLLLSSLLRVSLYISRLLNLLLLDRWWLLLHLHWLLLHLHWLRLLHLYLRLLHLYLLLFLDLLNRLLNDLLYRLLNDLLLLRGWWRRLRLRSRFKFRLTRRTFLTTSFCWCCTTTLLGFYFLRLLALLRHMPDQFPLPLIYIKLRLLVEVSSLNTRTEECHLLAQDEDENTKRYQRQYFPTIVDGFNVSIISDHIFHYFWQWKMLLK